MLSKHPITPIPLHNGRLGLCGCPGGSGAFLGRPEPDSGLDALAKWPAATVVTLMESRELETLGLDDLPARLRERFPLWLHLPIRDGDIPGNRWMDRWQFTRLVIAALLAEGDNVAIHCLAGVGRTGTVAAMCLVDAGFGDGRKAIDHVRAVHNVHAAETPEQEAFVEHYRPSSILTPEKVHEQLADFVEQAGLDPILDDNDRLDRGRAARLLG
ncbi:MULTISPECIES: dual specificity protein phosphatase family protein [unclassified Wenzhouxiangella]|uniref:phosphatase domain-containing putative toxin n=1 Tax=unclassified Wenzhouxiangella TaxID=2613841 RepID=UPI000E328CD3|nr:MULTISPECIES: dual specificity protein phosphatase family protein [unclassified Wenzhouxiangella]RFF27682.1 phosphatase [Wenzhouxiangella sp. 15181]RFP69774.1 phosphatase [Wenzhouxiangella sp. 15190]